MTGPTNNPPAAEADSTPLQQALALHRQGKHDLAMQRYVAILQGDPNNTDALYYVAVLAIQEGQIDEGIKVVRRALEVGGPQARLHNLMGQAHLRKNQDDDALAAFGQAIATDGNFADAYGNRGTVYGAKGDHDRAISDYSEAIRLDPKLTAAYNGRGNAYWLKSDFDRAIADYDQVIRAKKPG